MRVRPTRSDEKVSRGRSIPSVARCAVSVDSREEKRSPGGEPGGALKGARCSNMRAVACEPRKSCVDAGDWQVGLPAIGKWVVRRSVSSPAVVSPTNWLSRGFRENVASCFAAGPLNLGPGSRLRNPLFHLCSLSVSSSRRARRREARCREPTFGIEPNPPGYKAGAPPWSCIGSDRAHVRNRTGSP